MRSLLLGMIWLLALPPGAAHAQDERPWATVLGADVLRRSDVALVGTIGDVSEVAGRRVTVLHLAIEETLWRAPGPAARELKAGGRLSAIQNDRAERFAKKQRVFICLRRLGASWGVEELQFVGGQQGAARLRTIRELLELEAQPPGAERDAAHREQIVGGLQDVDAWVFAIALGELYRRIGLRRGQLHPPFRRELSRLAFSLRDVGHQRQLREMLRLLPPPQRGAPVSAGSGDAPADGPALTAEEAIAAWREAEGAARQRLLWELLRFPADEVVEPLRRRLRRGPLAERRDVAFLLGELRAASALPALRAAAADRDAILARRAVRALGLLADAAAERTLIAALAREATADEALRALARLDSAGARAALQRVARSGSPAGRRALARHYLGQAAGPR